MINVLPKNISELIAAGEVIERPASVIKELTENAIDAGSRHITIEIKDGGTTYMRITDDGCGISYEDVPKAFLRHSTSKIRTTDDLDKILTLGFRGEALASVCAVSKVEVLTKPHNCEYGVHYTIDGGTETLYENSGCPDGTTIIVRDLFYNVPARLKFMKKNVAEGNAVRTIVNKMAVSHPEIAFKFIRDNKPEFTSVGDGDLYSAIYAVYGRDFAQDLIPVKYNGDKNITVNGYIMKPLYSRGSRSYQDFFINNRYIKSFVCTGAVEEAFKGTVMTGKFPACVLNIGVSPSVVDVNVHPAKTEVRFSNETVIRDAVFFAVKNALMNEGLVYDFKLQKEIISQENSIAENTSTPIQNDVPLPPKKDTLVTSITDTLNPNEFNDEVFESVQKNVPEFYRENISDFSYINEESFKKTISYEPPEIDTQPEIESNVKPCELRVIGEAFKNYILAEDNDEIIIIDKHAGHEKIIYERLKAGNTTFDKQYTMSDERINLSEEEFQALSENISVINDMGFELDLSSGIYATVKALPSFLVNADMNEVIPEIASNLCRNMENPRTDVLDDIFHSLACKSAIKANDKNNLKELSSLANEIYSNDKIRHCPHGRPVMFTITKSELEKQFRRKV